MNPSSSLPMGGLRELFRSPAAPGVALMVAAVVAFAWANSPWADGYAALLATPVAVEIGAAGLHKPLLLWINDGLMALFFLMVGLEVKREIVQGELSSLQKAALPVAAALGGMVVPALLYGVVNLGGPGQAGWAIPMATDIAFALGVLALLGERVPASLKVFLAALAVADDIGAVTIIALFYTSKLSVTALLVAVGLGALLLAFNRLRVQNLGVYMLVGVALWVAVLKSGVHATVAGVILALAVPLHGEEDDDHSPLVHLEHTLHPWVSWMVLPVFALANAGVTVLGAEIELLHPVALGTAAGLVVGKSLGVPGFAWVAVRLGLGQLPEGASWRDLVGVGMLAGIGFTMSIFVAGLSFSEAALLDTAKLGILGSSLLAGLLGSAVLLIRRR